MPQKPCLSIVIPVREGEYPKRAIESISRACDDHGAYEVLVVHGQAPSLQRNMAARSASADILYFLDDDSYVRSHSIISGLQLFRNADADVVGGPALTHPDATFFERCVGEVFSSFFGTGNTRARNIPVGDVRAVGGEELVLCNLMVRKSTYEKANGLDTKLYPGEDPEFIKRLNYNGARLFYHPGMRILRGRRKSFSAFVKQAFTYGRGRGLHVLHDTRAQDLPFFLPLLFLCYVLLLPIMPPGLAWLPLIAYLVLASISSLLIGIGTSNAALGISAFPLFPTLHLCYGAGLAYGLGLHLNGAARDMVSPVKITVVNISAESQAAIAMAGSLR